MHRAHKLFALFPPPQFLAMPSFGIDISDRSIRFAKLRQEHSALVLDSYGERRFPQGIIENGTIKDKEALVRVLQDMREKNGMTFIRASIPEQRSYLVRMTLPDSVSPRELRGSVELQMEGKIPLAPQDAVFDYTRTECDGTEDASGSLTFGVAALSKAISEQYANVFQEAGLTPISFELEAHAIARSVMPEEDCGTAMIVDIGATRTGISIVSRGDVHFTATLSVGGNLLTESIAREYNLSFERAKGLKEDQGLTQAAQEDGEHYDLFSILIPAVSTLRDEIRRYFYYWRQHAGEAEHGGQQAPEIERVILCGGEANVPGLREYFSASLEENVEIANPWINIVNVGDTYIPQIPRNHSLRYTTALGLALRSF